MELLEYILDDKNLFEAYKQVYKNKGTSGIDEITVEELGVYMYNHKEEIKEQIRKLQYKPNPVRRVEIPKENGKTRKLGIPTVVDRLIQQAMVQVLSPIFEQQFSNYSYGFRPKRSCEMAVIKVLEYFNDGYDWIVDIDLQAFFDNVNQDKLIGIIRRTIKDGRVVSLIRKYLVSGVMINGVCQPTKMGTPQGSILSPVLANIVMYYLIILEVERIKKTTKGYVEIVNYADDMILCFQYKSEAEKTYKLLKERLRKCGLEFAEDKTRLITFGRLAFRNYEMTKLNKPDTFDFLGFTHYCSKSKNGKFRVKRKTSRKKFKQKVQEFKIWIKGNRNKPLEEILETAKKKLNGHFNYYGITDNFHSIRKFKWIVMGYLFKYLNRRSQRKSFTWSEFERLLEIMNMPKANIRASIYAI